MMLIAAFAFAFAIYYLEIKVYRRFWKKGLSVRLLFLQKGINVGETCILQEMVTNEKNMPVPVLDVKFSTSASFKFEDSSNTNITDHFYRRDMFSLKKYQKVTRQLEFVATKRGYYTIPEIDVLSKDYLFAENFAVKYPNDTALYVYPKKLDTRLLNPFFSQMMGEIVTKQRVEEDLYAFRGLREYRPTDSMRRINWKNTAHSGKMLVNLYETTTTVEVCMLVDGDVRLPFDHDILQEEIISLASSISGDLIKKGIAIHLRTNLKDTISKEPVLVKMSAGKNHIEVIDQAMARVNLKGIDETIYEMAADEIRKNGKNKCYLILASDFSDQFIRMIQNYQREGIAVYAVVPYTGKNMTKKLENDLFSKRKSIFPWKMEV